MPVPASDPSLIFDDRGGIVIEVPSNGGPVQGTSKPETFYLEGTGAPSDNVTIKNFGRTDILVLDQALVDSNGDGYITFGRNGVLDRDGPDAGTASITFQGGPNPNIGLRVLGVSDDGYFVYADGLIRKNLGSLGQEGTLQDDTLAGRDGKRDLFLFDTGLDVAWGNDTINNFDSEDFVVTTTRIFDGNGDGKISFVNGILDLNGNGEIDPSHSGWQQQNSPWGKVDINADSGDVTALFYNGSASKNGVFYHFYSLKADNAPTFSDVPLA